MQIVPVECGNCGAKLKVKRASAAVTQVKCPKCQKPIPLPKETPAEAPPPPTATPPPAPAVPAAETTTPSSPPPTPAPAVAPAPAPRSSAEPAPVTLSIPPALAASASEPKKPIVLSPFGKTSAGLVSAICENCQREMKVPGELAGKKVRCKTCGTPVTVPEPPASPAPVTTDEQGLQLQARLAAAEARALAAEKALQELTAQKVQESAALQKRIAELEGQLAGWHGWKEQARRDLQSEIETAERHIAELKDRLSRLT